MTHLLLRALFSISPVLAQTFDGPGLEGGVAEASLIEGPAQGDLRDVILSFVHTALGFLGLAGVVMVIVAGILMVVGGGSEESKEKAKKIILYVVIGLLIVFVARSLVGFFLNDLP